MGSTEVPSQSKDTIKIPTAHYEFGANFLDPKVGLHNNWTLNVDKFYSLIDNWSIRDF